MDEIPAVETSLPTPEPVLPVPGNGSIRLLRDLAVSVVLAVFLIVFIYQPVKVEGTSMMPGLTDQERIFINKYEYKIGIGQIQRLDLVVFHFPLDPSQSYIKRVVGLPGDEVEIVDGDVYVNGQMLEETSATISDVAAACGYADHSAFSRQFRAATHMTPLRYRAAQQAAGAERK